MLRRRVGAEDDARARRRLRRLEPPRSARSVSRHAASSGQPAPWRTGSATERSGGVSRPSWRRHAPTLSPSAARHAVRNSGSPRQRRVHHRAGSAKPRVSAAAPSASLPCDSHSRRPAPAAAAIRRGSGAACESAASVGFMIASTSSASSGACVTQSSALRPSETSRSGGPSGGNAVRNSGQVGMEDMQHAFVSGRRLEIWACLSFTPGKV